MLCCVALCCCHALYLFCFDVVFSSLLLHCAFPVVLRFLSCLLSFVELSRIASPCFVLFLPVFGMVCCLRCFAFLPAVLSSVGSLVLRCVTLRCVLLVFFCRRCIVLCCVALRFVL